jgi:hypothetical protein
MKLTRLVVHKRPGGIRVVGNFRGAGGKRVRLPLGQADDNADLLRILERVEEAAGDMTELRKIGRV